LSIAGAELRRRVVDPAERDRQERRQENADREAPRATPESAATTTPR
jgi:hypothetical protein